MQPFIYNIITLSQICWGKNLQSMPNSILRQCQLNDKEKFDSFSFYRIKIYFLPSLQTQTAS